MIQTLVTIATSTIKRTSTTLLSFLSHQHHLPPVTPQLQLIIPSPTSNEHEYSNNTINHPNNNNNTNNTPPSLTDCLWLAVPKRKVTPGKKRMKTTIQYRIPKKTNIIVDQRTGELTLKHKLPFNWRDYLPASLSATEGAAGVVDTSAGGGFADKSG